MIVDIRTRAWTGRDPLPSDARVAFSRSRTETDPTPDGHRRAMAVVDAAVVVGWRAERIGVHIPAAQVAAIVNRDPDRLFGFAGVDATAPGAIDEIDAAVDMGHVGVTISPADQGCRPTDDRCMAVFEHAARRALPVMVANPGLLHPGSVAEFAQTILLDEAARSFRGLTLVLGDLGSGWIDEALLLAARHERVFVELSGVVARTSTLAATLMQAYERGVLNKVLFGSGFPAETPERAIERLYTLGSFRSNAGMPTVPREAVRSVVERDALSVLGVQTPGMAARTSTRRPIVAAGGHPAEALEVAVEPDPAAL